MQPAVGTAKKMTGMLMGAETIDQYGYSLIFFLPDVSVHNLGMSESLISAGRPIKVGFNVNVRIPDDALTDGFALAIFPLYRGSITTPEILKMIVIE